jgi:hypothetical protein
MPPSLWFHVRGDVHGAVAGCNVNDFGLASSLPPRLGLWPPIWLRLRIQLQIHLCPWKHLRLRLRPRLWALLRLQASLEYGFDP